MQFGAEESRYGQHLQRLEEGLPTPKIEVWARKTVSPVAPSKKITNLEKRIASYSGDIKTTESSLEVQRDRLQKMIANKEAPGSRLKQHGLVTKLEEDLRDLQKTRELARKKLEKARGKVVEVALSTISETAPEKVPYSWFALEEYIKAHPGYETISDLLFEYSQLAIEEKAYPDIKVDALFQRILETEDKIRTFRRNTVYVWSDEVLEAKKLTDIVHNTASKVINSINPPAFRMYRS